MAQLAAASALTSVVPDGPTMARGEGAMPVREVLIRPLASTAGDARIAEPGEAER